MSDTILQADVVDRPISTEEVAGLVASATAGAVVTFAGVVRDHDGGRTVTSLQYESHPTAAGEIAAVAASIAEAYPDVRIAVLHRVGALRIGDVALAAAVASAHRAEAFAACALLVDTVKERVPIWKHQVFADGSDEWVAAL
ncbi:molybdenum cofactor biosynthesis protein MoaE [Curtobacterium ammoniigenes]|uniref:molybdenum cofactor biosynthesis protein MoaE n=1 Tax=Curtobacterium ammoniigenes TaxID=395387 RepID=UPI00082E5609|nr:molybdenum cofactor biosynthesis protein MoaE [Curtobacterium ammoniigenes]